MRLRQLINDIDDWICINPHTLETYYERSISLITQSLKLVTQTEEPNDGGFIYVMPTINITKRAKMVLDHSTINILLKIALSAVVVNDCELLSLLESAAFPVFLVSKTTTTDRIFAQLCIHYYNYPRHSIGQMIGVTGTNGKTTVTHMIEKVLLDAKLTVGLIGTLGYRCHGHESNTNDYINAGYTTPNAWILQTILNEMKNEYHIDNVVMEVSSHALTVDRVYGCDFNVAIFTNLTHDHLGFHKTKDNYLRAKLSLFSEYLSKSLSTKAIINHDDPLYEQFISACPSNAQVYTYGLSTKSLNSFVANDIKNSLNGVSYTLLLSSGETRRVHLNIHGDFNVYNTLACIATCFITYSSFLTLDQIIQSLESFQGVKGRFEFIIRHRPFSVVIDFAHTPDALEKVIKSGRQILSESEENGRLIVVFGSSGGEYPPTRPLFGRIADENADIMIITSENPCQENPQAIIDEILSGISQKPDDNRLYVESNRKQAIHLAMDLANNKNDLILITGKGHERTQTFANHAIQFNEKEIIEEKYKQMMQDNPFST
ncbi:unnamed protein product [Rotaria sp. Silwood2]|nr:unnamed protein product [Rotaria sp. Silwood2]CAF4203526.1 unnamed protein product [Rotaria sp. Silwood2]